MLAWLSKRLSSPPSTEGTAGDRIRSSPRSGEPGPEQKFKIEQIEPRILLSADNPLLAEAARLALQGEDVQSAQNSVHAQQIDAETSAEIAAAGGTDSGVAASAAPSVAWGTGWGSDADSGEPGAADEALTGPPSAAVVESEATLQSSFWSDFAVAPSPGADRENDTTAHRIGLGRADIATAAVDLPGAPLPRGPPSDDGASTESVSAVVTGDTAPIRSDSPSGDGQVGFGAGSIWLIDSLGDAPALSAAAGPSLTAEAIAPAFRQCETPDSGATLLQPGVLHHDAARLAGGSGGRTDVVVQPGAVLGGSGRLGTVLNLGTLSPGYSPGVMTADDLTQVGSSVLEIELGGRTPGTGDGYHDQFVVTGHATLAGTLDVRLWKTFTASAGDEFVILRYSTVSGQFAAARGLFGLSDDVWFDIVQTGDANSPGEVKLVARELVAGAANGLALVTGAGFDAAAVADAKNGIGELLNIDYFATARSVSFNGGFDLGSLAIDGQFTLSAAPGASRVNLTATGITVAIAGQAVTGDVAVSIPLLGSGDVYLGIEDATLTLSAGTGAGALQLRLTGIAGSVLAADDGTAGLLHAESLALTDGNGLALPAMTFAGVTDIQVGFNSTGRAVASTLGSHSFDYSAEAQHDFLAIDADLDIQFGDSLLLSGHFGIESDQLNQQIVFIGQDASASLAAGDFRLGASGADMGVAFTSAGIALQAQGELLADLGGYVTLSADAAAVYYNSTGLSWTDQTLTAGSLSFAFEPLAATDLLGATVTGGTLSVGDFVKVTGNFSASTASADLALSDASTLDDARLLRIGGSGLSAFAGIGASSQRTGLAISDLSFGLLLVSEVLPNDALGRSWTVFRGNAGSIGVEGAPGLEMAGNNLMVELVRASADGKLIDFSAEPINLSLGDGDTITIDYDAAAGELTRVAGTVNLVMVDFLSISGSFAIERSRADVTLSDGTDLTVNLLRIGAKELSAFAGLNGGGPDALGFSLAEMSFGLALMSDEANEARKWMAMQGSIGEAGFVGVDGLSVDVSTLNLAINRNLSTQGTALPQPDAKDETILTIRTSLAAGTLVLALSDSQQVAMTLAANRTAESTRNELRRKLEALLVAAGHTNAQGELDGTIIVTGDEVGGFNIRFGGALAGTDFSSLTVTAEGAGVEGGSVEVLAGAAAVDAVTYSAATQDTRLALVLTAGSGTLRFRLDGETADAVITSGATDISIRTAMRTALERLSSVGAGNVTVSGSRAAGFTIDFTGAALAGKDLSRLALSFVPAAVSASVTLVTEGGTFATGQTTVTGRDLREIQKITFTGAITNTNVRYRLQAGNTISDLTDFSRSSPTRNVTTLQTAIDRLFGVGKAIVSFDQASTASAPEYFVRFSAPLAYTDVPLIQVHTETGVDVTVLGVQDGSSATVSGVNTQRATVQEVRLSSPEPRSFRLALDHGGSVRRTGVISSSADTEDVQSALNAVLSDIADVAVTVEAIAGGGWRVSFGGSLQGVAVPAMRIELEPLQTGASLSVVQRGFTRITTETVTTPAVNEVQQVLVGSEGDGRFALSLEHNGTTYTTGSLSIDAGALQVQSALAQSFVAGGLVGATLTVVSTSDGAYEITFGGTLGGTDLDALAVTTQRGDAVAEVEIAQKGATRPLAPLMADVDPDLVVDFAASGLQISTGPLPGDSITLDMDGLEGALSRVSGQLTLDLFGMLQLDGGFAVEQSLATVKDAQGNSIAVERLTMGAGGVDAFLGTGAGTASKAGLELTEVDFALALFTERSPAAGSAPRSWSALTGRANAVGLVNLPGISLAGSDLEIAVSYTHLTLPTKA